MIAFVYFMFALLIVCLIFRFILGILKIIEEQNQLQENQVGRKELQEVIISPSSSPVSSPKTNPIRLYDEDVLHWVLVSHSIIPNNNYDN
jgi:hypothetical protein